MNTVKSFIPSDSINSKHRKENAFLEAFSLIAFDDGKFTNPVELRIYGTQSKNYACLWIHGEFAPFGNYTSASGSGTAGGYGYHRVSAAAAEAFENAGLQFEKSISGVGNEAIIDSLKGIAQFLGIKNYTVHFSHP